MTSSPVTSTWFLLMESQGIGLVWEESGNFSWGQEKYWTRDCLCDEQG